MLFFVCKLFCGRMDWTELTQPGDIKEAVEGSLKKPVLIFKHSTRCSLSSAALNRIQRNMNKLMPVADLYLVNVIQNRNVSNSIAENFSIKHESPQVLVFYDGRCVYTASHLAIDASSILDAIGKQ